MRNQTLLEEMSHEDASPQASSSHGTAGLLPASPSCHLPASSSCLLTNLASALAQDGGVQGPGKAEALARIGSGCAAATVEVSTALTSTTALLDQLNHDKVAAEREAAMLERQLDVLRQSHERSVKELAAFVEMDAKLAKLKGSAHEQRKLFKTLRETVRECMRAGMRAGIHACVRACVRACVHGMHTWNACLHSERCERRYTCLSSLPSPSPITITITLTLRSTRAPRPSSRQG